MILLSLLACSSLLRELGLHHEPAGTTWPTQQQLEQQLDPEQLESILYLLDLARKAAAEGHLEQSRAMLSEVGATLGEVDAPQSAEWLGCYSALDSVAEQCGDVRMQLVARTWIHEHTERRWPVDHPDRIAAKQRLALALGAADQFEQARQLFLDVYESRLDVHPPEHADLLNAKVNLAFSEQRLGNLRVAHDLLVEVIDVCAGMSSPPHPVLFRAKLNLGATKYELRDFAGSLELSQEVVGVWSQRLPAEHPDLLLAKLNLGVDTFMLGDFAGAHSLFAELFEIWHRSLPAGHPNLLRVQLNLAATQRALGELVESHELLGEVLAALTELHPPEHSHVLRAKLNLASAKYDLGDFAGAQRLFEEMLEVESRLFAAEHPEILRTQLNLAATLSATGDPAGARELGEHVLAVRSRLLPPDHPDLLNTQLNHAVTLHSNGNVLECNSLVRSLLAGMLERASSLRTKSRRVDRETARTELDRLAGALFLTNDTEGGAPLSSDLFATLESLRMVSIAGPEVTHALAGRPRLSQMRDQLVELEGRLHDVCSSPPRASHNVEDWRREVWRITERRDSVERNLRAKLAEAGVFVEAIDPASVGRSLDTDGLAVSYLRYPRYLPRDPATGARPAPIDVYLAFLVRPDASVERIELGPASEIEDLVYTWRASLGKPIGPQQRASGAPVVPGERLSDQADGEHRLGSALRRRVFDPVLARLEESPGRVYIVPDEALHLVPFDALPWGESPHRVGEQMRIYYELSFQRLVSAPRPASEQGALLALGGIDFDGRQPKSGQEGEPSRSFSAVPTPPLRARKGQAASFEPLPQSQHEIAAVARCFKLYMGTTAVVLRGKDARKDALFAHAPAARFLHLATHGWFASEAFRSQLDEPGGAGEHGFFERAERTLRGFAPETLCGLALAGANLGRDAAGRVPGILTAGELSTLDLRSCDLAVLSACETNVGIRRAGQGIQSLQSALHAAGARTAMTSLWKVDDTATRRLMELFYAKLLRDKLGKADALWDTKMALRARGYAPRDWAGWVLTGEPN